MAALSRGCKPRIREGSTLRICPRPVAFLTGKVPCERTYITAQLWSVRNIVNKGSFKNFNGTFYETKTSGKPAAIPKSPFRVLSCVCVVVQFYSWFKIFFPLFWGMEIYGNEFKTKRKVINLKPRINLNYNKYVPVE